MRMKRIMVGAVGLGLLGVAGPVTAGPTATTFETWEQCAATAAAVTSKAWIVSCVPASGGGYQIVYTHKRNMGA
jgi:hypothetical protein